MEKKMATIKKKKFKWKSFFSFFALFVIIILFLTGIVLYFKPPGRIANWSHWTFLGLEKEQWQAIHTIFSFTFVIISSFHLYFNWKVLMSYFKKRMQSGIHLKRELLWSSVFTIFILVSTLGEIPPFSTIMIWGEDLSNSWASEGQNEPPIPHAEELTLAKLAETEKMSVDQLINKLKNQGIDPQNEQEIVGNLAKRYNLTPKQLFDKIQVKSAGRGSQGGRGFGGGFGRKTVAQLCEEAKIPVETGLERLRQKNINAKPTNTVRDLINKEYQMPVEIANIIQGIQNNNQLH
jgi:hypothetical protein